MDRPTPPPHRLDDFAGRWRVTREITDRAAGHAGRFEGEATLSPEGEALRYLENGVLTLPGAPPMAATRVYLWHPAPGGVAVHFDDGRFFHAIALDGPRPEAMHDCPPDTYRVAYDFTGWPVWRAVWDVTGPRKDYRMASLYTRP